MRPLSLDDYCGQEEILSEGSLLRRAIEDDHISSMILWGPPGSGKTTLARLIASTTKSFFATFSAVSSGVKDVRQVVAEARERMSFNDRKTILFVDEIHRFNKIQQDTFLPYIEDGTILLVGATTENPSFEVNSALLSRARVFVLKALETCDICEILIRAITDKENGLGTFDLEITDEALTYLAEASAGDARRALNGLEASALAALNSTNRSNAAASGSKDREHTTINSSKDRENTTDDSEHNETAGEKSAIQKSLIDTEVVKQALNSGHALYDKDGEQHYNLISALHKSLRDSDVQASLYWLFRMLQGGEAPLYIARRLVRFASEDIGLADPQALVQALAAKDAVHFIGLPEGDNCLAQAVIYLATAPKSNAVYQACNAAKQLIKQTPAYGVPMHLRNAPTRLMKEIGYGDGYQYAHDEEDNVTTQEDLPEELKNTVFYRPGRFGFEKDISKRLEYFSKRKKSKQKKS
jgi:putative ATPase